MSTDACCVNEEGRVASSSHAATQGASTTVRSEAKVRCQSVRPKRRGLYQWLWERIYIPVPVPLKSRFTEVARRLGTTQAELGMLIIERAMKELRWTVRTVRDHQKSVKGEIDYGFES